MRKRRAFSARRSTWLLGGTAKAVGRPIVTLIELSAIGSILAGIVGALSLGHSSLPKLLGAITIGGVVGLASFLLCMCPGGLAMHLAKRPGIVDSKWGEFAAFLLFAGVVAAPFVSFPLAVLVMRRLIALVSA